MSFYDVFCFTRLVGDCRQNFVLTDQMSIMTNGRNLHSMLLFRLDDRKDLSLLFMTFRKRSGHLSLGGGKEEWHMFM